MKGSFRTSMSWLHTWGGLSVGWLLYFMFITGTAGYFVSEIDYWMQPEMPHLNETAEHSQLLLLAEQHLNSKAPTAKSWRINLPSERERTLTVRWQDGDGRHKDILHPVSGDVVNVRDTGGGEQLYEMHYRLHYMPRTVAFIITSLCGMFMLIALITGLVIHKKIFIEFFTFRPGKKQRSWLDMHNILSVLPLPFHLMITYSGLIFLMFTTMPAIFLASYGVEEEGRQRFISELRSTPTPIKATGNRMNLTSLPGLLEKAENSWGQGNVSRFSIEHPGDSHARITLQKRRVDQVSDEQKLIYHGVTGQLLSAVDDVGSSASKSFYALMIRLHIGEFAGTALRWLYFLSGLMGAGMIATGMVLWANKRRTKADKSGRSSKGLVLVEHLNVGTITGLPIAIAAYFLANRLIPLGLENRAEWEINILFITWASMLVYPVFISKFKQVLAAIWVQQLMLASMLYLMLPVINVMTSNKHLGASLLTADWVRAGFDVSMLLIGLCFGLAAFKMQLKKQSAESQATAKAAKKTVPTMLAEDVSP